MLKVNNTEDGFIFNNTLIEPIEKRYSELKTMHDGSTLIPGQLYKMTDFATVHNILDGNTTSGDINTGINEPLILLATSVNTFDKQVYSTLFPNDIIHYDITGGDTRDIAFFNTVDEIAYNVINMNTTIPPILPAGNIEYQLPSPYFIPHDATGEWAEHIGEIAFVTDLGGLGHIRIWTYSPLYEREIIYDLDTETYWISINSTLSEYTDGEIQDLKGIIYYRKDTVQNVETWYDFRNVKFRRWLVSATEWISGGTYSANDVYSVTETIIPFFTFTTMFNNTPPLNPQQNEYYLVGDNATGDWVGLNHKVVQYHNGTWVSDIMYYHGIMVLNLENSSYYQENGVNTWLLYTPINILYKCIKDHTGLTDDPGVDTVNWIKWLDKTQKWSWISNASSFNIGNVTTTTLSSSSPSDYLTFGDYYNWVNDVSIGKINLDYIVYSNETGSILNNIIFNTIDDINTCYQNSFGSNCIFNTIGTNFNNNNIGNEFYSNVIGNIFDTNKMGNYVSANNILGYFQGNNIGDNFSSNNISFYFQINNINNNFNNNVTLSYFLYNKINISFQQNIIRSFGCYSDSSIISGNVIGDYFEYNTIGENCYGNIIGNHFGKVDGPNIISSEFQNNMIGNDFHSNTIGNNYKNNTIVISFNTNTVGNWFDSNKTSNIFNNNIIGDNFTDNILCIFQNNNIGTDFYYNNTGHSFRSNTIVNSFQYNDIKYNVTSIDFTSATHVYANYSCEITKNSIGTLRLKYMVGDNDTIANITD